MAPIMKGIFKGMKHISQIFVYKERELEIGLPTDVKHVAHIGWDGATSPPSWMNEFKPTTNFTASQLPSYGPSKSTRDTWNSPESQQSRGLQTDSETCTDSCSKLPKKPKKPKRKKTKVSSPSSSMRPSSRKPKAKFSTDTDGGAEGSLSDNPMS